MGWDLGTVNEPVAKVEILTNHVMHQFDPFGPHALGDRIFADVATSTAFGTGPYTNLYEKIGGPDSLGMQPPGSEQQLFDITSFLDSDWLSDPGLLELKFGYQQHAVDAEHPDIPPNHIQLFRDETDEAIDGFRLKVTLASAVPEPAIVPFELDIKPGSDPNSVNLKSKGVLPVAILSTDEFDVSDINVTTLLFGDPLLLDDGGTPASPLRYAFEDVSDDGLLDLTLKFSMRDLVGYDALGPDTIEGLLTGELFDGTPIEGLDSIRIVPPNGSNGSSGASGNSVLVSSAIPEPSSATLAACPLLGLAVRRRRRP